MRGPLDTAIISVGEATTCSINNVRGPSPRPRGRPPLLAAGALLRSLSVICTTSFLPSGLAAAHPAYFRVNWLPCGQNDGGWAAGIGRESSFAIVPSSAAGRASWLNLSIGANRTSSALLEGPMPSCHGNPDYSSVRCNAAYQGAAYTATCFDLLPLVDGRKAAAALRYGAAVVLREPAAFDTGRGRVYLNPATAAFDQTSRAAAGWVLVDPADPGSADTFRGGAFALRSSAAHVHPPPPPPPAPAPAPSPFDRSTQILPPRPLIWGEGSTMFKVSTVSN